MRYEIAFMSFFEELGIEVIAYLLVGVLGILGQAYYNITAGVFLRATNSEAPEFRFIRFVIVAGVSAVVFYRAGTFYSVCSFLLLLVSYRLYDSCAEDSSHQNE